MLITDSKTVLERIAKKKVPLSTIIWGPTGIGKSASVKQLAKELGYKLIDIRLSQREAVDILGIPYTAKVNINDKEMNALAHHPPEWFLRALMEGQTVLFLDELNRARPEVLQAVFELALDRQLNGEKLPHDVLIVSACNPPDPRYDTVDFDDALTARFMHLHVKTNSEIWLDWAKKKEDNGKQRINQFVTNFIAQNTDALNVEHKEDSEFPVTVKPCSRSWEFVSYVESLELPDNLTRECIRGIVGLEIATAYMSTRTEGDKPISIDELFAMTSDEHDQVRERVRRFVNNDDGKIRSDLLKETCKDIERNKDEYKNDELKASKVLDFLEMITADLAQATLKRIYKHSKMLQDAIVARPVLIKMMTEMQNSVNSVRTDKT